jgi:shikimate dehydrogenase
MQPLADNADTAAGQDVPIMTDKTTPPKLPELGGPAGPDPSRYGDWERRGRCIDF